MRAALLLCYECSASLLPFALLLLHQGRRRRERDLCRPRRYYLGLLLLACYVTALLHLTEAGTLWQGLNWGFHLRPERINLIPFSRDMDISHPGNILAFIPLGWLLPCIWKKWDQLWRTAGAGLALSLLIEVSQLLNHRFSDVDDLILNSLGTVLGFALFRLTARPLRRPRVEASGWELPLCLLALTAGRFFLFDSRLALSLAGG